MAIDMRSPAAGHASAWKTVSTRGLPSDEGNRLKVSPTAFRTMAAAKSIHGAVILPESRVEAPTTRVNSSRSPIG